MLTALVFLMILVGVTISWYQIYQMHFNINTYDSAKLSGMKTKMPPCLMKRLWMYSVMILMWQHYGLLFLKRGGRFMEYHF